MKVRLSVDDEAKGFFDLASQKKGFAYQMGLVNEECAELIVALNHVVRKKKDMGAVVDEIADVLVMMGQLTAIVGDKRVNERIDFKLARAHKILTDEDPPI